MREGNIDRDRQTDRDTQTETDRDRDRELTKTLFYKDCSLGERERGWRGVGRQTDRQTDRTRFLRTDLSPVVTCRL